MNGTRASAPTPLVVAALLVAVQGLGLVVFGVVGLLDVVPSRVEVGVSVGVFFAAYGAGLLACAWALLQRHGWARGPVLLTQLIQVGVAWNARENLLLAVPLVLVAAAVVAAMLHPATIRALLDDPTGSAGSAGSDD